MCFFFDGLHRTWSCGVVSEVVLRCGVFQKVALLMQHRKGAGDGAALFLPYVIAGGRQRRVRRVIVGHRVAVAVQGDLSP